ERGTITTLLVSQLSRAEIALGKVLTTVTMAILSVVLNLVSLVLGMLLLARATGEELPTGLLDVLSVSSILELLVVLLPFGCMVSAGIVLLGTFARNSKEGNLYVLPLFFLVMALGMASSGMDASVGVGLYAVPFMGPLLAIKQVILSTDHVAGFVVAVLSSLVYTVMLIWPAVRLYQREEVLFRM
ncbi:MAG TPA: ABC transporter permease, partial [Bacilli bacterium]|nr:ABC transporter permease [Bacilli bacterium]